MTDCRTGKVFRAQHHRRQRGCLNPSMVCRGGTHTPKRTRRTSRSSLDQRTVASSPQRVRAVASLTRSYSIAACFVCTAVCITPKTLLQRVKHSQLVSGFLWRTGRDSNPRYSCPYAAFRVRCFRPLSHLSVWGHPLLTMQAERKIVTADIHIRPDDRFRSAWLPFR